MRRILHTLMACTLVASAPAADSVEERLREASETSRTNLSLALELAGQAVAASPTNTQALALRARLLDRARRYDEGIRDLTIALKLDPRRLQFWQGRGEMNFKAGHFQESVADFDRVIEMSPAQAPHHWQRGLSLYYAGRFADGRKQFELHQTVNPNDVENAAWHFLCTARETSLTNARARLLPQGKDSRVPMQEIYGLCAGTKTAAEVLEVARRAADDLRIRDAMFYAHLYIGLYYEVVGDGGKAREHLKLAAGDKDADHYMGDVARAHLKQPGRAQ